ncbi:MAG: aminopeptidase P family protein [Oligoflexus sp.]
MEVKDRIHSLQKILAENNLDAYVVPSADPHQSEYVADEWKRRQFISGFSGSAGTFACTQSESGLWTDSRYFLQAEKELLGSGASLFRQKQPGVPEWYEWVATNLPKHGRLGIDLNLFSIDQYRQIQNYLQNTEIEIVATEQNLVDQVWGKERPSSPNQSIYEHPLEYAGEGLNNKLQRLRLAMQEIGARAMVLSALDEIAWLFNLRGKDVEYNPVFYAFAVVTNDDARIFINTAKVTTEIQEKLKGAVSFAPYEDLLKHLGRLPAEDAIWLDPASNGAAVWQSLLDNSKTTIIATNPIAAWKAKKNEAEIAGMQAAHIRDGVAVVRFLKWLDEQVGKQELNELNVAAKLYELRSEAQEFHGESFSTIAGYGANGALPHYRATEKSFSAIKAEGIFLCDSGGQYVDGTTDITRTIACGEASAWHKKVYTTVLKGHLQLARSQFPQGTTGYQLDVLARQPIWQLGLDYGHGTGHGVGAALCVHEGPFSISPRQNMTCLEAGNVLSNEPGIYLDGEFGVRIENLMVVTPAKNKANFLAFQDLTLCPYDKRLIDVALLSGEEVAQINTYHQQVYHRLSPLLQSDELEYLQQATAAI